MNITHSRRHWLRRLLGVGLYLGSGVLFFWGYSHFRDGQAHDKSLPVPDSMTAGRQLPPGAYRQGAVALASSSSANGEARIAYGEALLDAGFNPEQQVDVFRSGVSKDPASVRGWALLALSSAKRNPKFASAALAQALLLAPADYWNIGLRVRAATFLWNFLDRDSQEIVLSQTRMLWDIKGLRPSLLTLLALPGGAAIVTQAFQKRHDDLISLNRWVAGTTRQESTMR